MRREPIRDIIVLKNIYSNVFEEIVFVLKKDAAKKKDKNINLVSEAKKIVEDYVNGDKINSGPKPTVSFESNYGLNGFERGKKLDLVLNISLGLSLILFIALLINIF